MKKIISLLAAFFVAGVALAQDSAIEKMARRMTEQMTADYSLTKKQVRKIQALNEDFASKVLSMTARMGQGQGEGHRRGGGPRGVVHRRDSLAAASRGERAGVERARRAHPEDVDTALIRQQREAKRRERRERMKAHEAEARKIRDDYDAAIAGILTGEQLSKYREAHGGHDGHGRR